ncbi:hypothetical protein KAR91_85170 [Candidatus Pacearchaeota archaeon]|nr:hypothetical protein [Candidatus Pacearchaeota archaeon]
MVNEILQWVFLGFLLIRIWSLWKMAKVNQEAVMTLLAAEIKRTEEIL